MLDSTSTSSKNKRGVSILLTVILLATALFMVFGTIKFLEMTDISLRLTYVAMQSVQKGRLQIPSEQHALESMAMVARLNGFSEAAPVETVQNLKEGQIQFSYDDSINTEPSVRVHVTQGSGLLAGTFRGFSSSSDRGIEAETSQSALAGGISTGATLVYADLSDSMRGPNFDYTSGENSRISELLRAYGLDVIEGGRQSGVIADPVGGISTGNPAHTCWPIDISDCLASSASQPASWGLSNRSYTRAHQCCNAARLQLPGYLGFTVVAPGRPYRPGTRIGSSPGVPVDVDYQSNLPLAPYNPGLPASAQDDPSETDNELRLVCNNKVSNLGEVPSGGPFPNYPGFRVGEFDHSTCLNSGACGRFLNSDNSLATRFTNNNITDRDMCVAPWHYWKDWRLEREDSPWGGSPSAPEIAQYGGFATQMGLLINMCSDFFITYKRLTEAFLIGVSDFNSHLVFSVFGGTTPFGAVHTAGASSQGFMSGNYELYNGFSATYDIEHQPIDVSNLLSTAIPNSGTPSMRLPTAMNVLTGYYRTRLLAHLDRTHYPNLNPGEDTPFPTSGHLWPGSEHLMALRNPKVNRPKGESLPWGLLDPVLNPASVLSFYNFHLVDLSYSTQPVPMFPPGPRNMDFFPGFTMSPHYMSPTFQRHKWWPLKAVSNAGIQSSEDYDIPMVHTYARELFGQGLGPMKGGTHIRSVIKHMNDVADSHADETGGVNGHRWFSVIVSDGKPNEPSASGTTIQAAYPTAASFVQPAPAITYFGANGMKEQIVNGLVDFESKVPALTILLFIEHSPPDAETEDFIGIFDPAQNGGNYKRAAFRINYVDVQDFREKYKEALLFISVLLKSTTKFIR